MAISHSDDVFNLGLLRRELNLVSQIRGFFIFGPNLKGSVYLC